MQPLTIHETTQSEGAPLAHRRVLFLFCPTGAYCREDRCQSFFSFSLVPSMRAPLEEAEAAGAVRAAGARARVIDAPALRMTDEGFLREVSGFEPDLLVLTVTFGTLTRDLEWAARLRLCHPGITIGVRGAPCYEEAEAILRRTSAVDFCVRGEYEVIFGDITRFGYRAARGTIFRRDGRIHAASPAAFVEDLDSLPPPDREAIDSSAYAVRFLRRPQATVRVQRGCPYPCSYCLVGSVSGRKARHRTPESVAREMSAVMNSGVRHFYLRAETFTLNKLWARETAAAISRLAPGARWVSTTRAELFDDETARALRASGCYGLSFGLDSGSAETARRTGKPLCLEEARAAFELCNRYRIISLAYLMIGFAWETRETLRETARYAGRMSPDLMTIHYAHPYPGTAYHAEVERQGSTVVSLRAQAEPAIEPEKVSSRELRRCASGILLRHYANPRTCWSLLRKLASI